MATLQKLGYLAGASRFRRISERLHIDGDKIYQEAGISFRASWFSVFYILSNASKPITILEITKQVDYSHVAVKNVLRELEKEGLVQISPNPKDKRSKIVSITKRGKKLRKRLGPIWDSFTAVLKETLEFGHPDILNILNRIDYEISTNPIHEQTKSNSSREIRVIDYKPSLKGEFFRLAAPWLIKVLNGELEVEDQYTLNNPEDAYLKQGGFLFFAKHRASIVGCVVLKRLDEDRFEFAKLFIDPAYRQMGIATRLIERCISRCKENDATEIWLQTTMAMPQAHKLYYKLGFVDKPPPPTMLVLERTQKTMFQPL